MSVDATIDLSVDLNTMDETGPLWSFLDETPVRSDWWPGRVTPRPWPRW